MSLSAQQLEQRRHGIGASDISAIAGINPYATAWDVWVSKTMPANDIEGENDAMALGHVLEEPIARMYLRRNPGVRLVPSLTLSHPKYPWAMATPDRIVFEGDREVRLLEVKTCGPNTARAWGKEGDEIPEAFIGQVSWQMFVTGHQIVDVAALVAGRLKFYRVERNEALIRFLVQKGEAFMELLASGKMPKIDASDAAKRYLLDEFPDADMPLRQATQEEADLAREYALHRERIKAAEKETDRLYSELLSRVGDAEGFTGYGTKVTFKTPQGVRTQWKPVAIEAGASDAIIAKHSSPYDRRINVNVK